MAASASARLCAMITPRCGQAVGRQRPDNRTAAALPPPVRLRCGRSGPLECPRAAEFLGVILPPELRVLCGDDDRETVGAKLIDDAGNSGTSGPTTVRSGVEIPQAPDIRWMRRWSRPGRCRDCRARRNLMAFERDARRWHARGTAADHENLCDEQSV
jgi:hypothetical protein